MGSASLLANDSLPGNTPYKNIRINYSTKSLPPCSQAKSKGITGPREAFVTTREFHTALPGLIVLFLNRSQCRDK